MTKRKFKLSIANLAVYFVSVSLFSIPAFATDTNSVYSAAINLYGPPNSDEPNLSERTLSQRNNRRIYDDDNFREQPYIPKNRTKTLDELEILFQILNAGDAFTTIDLLKRPNAREVNPIYGNHPSPVKVIAIKSLLGAFHFAVYRHLRYENDRNGIKFEEISIAIQGSITGANLRFYF